MNRRKFLQVASTSALAGASILSGCASVIDRTAKSSASAATQFGDAAHLSLRIAPIKLELSPRQTIQTIGYNGSAPGPLLRVTEGQQVTVTVRNDSDVPELVHWHGLYVPSEVDGAMEEGTPMVPAGSSRQYSFTAQPSGTRWYHTHAFAGKDLRRSLYSGQFGFFYIEPKNNPGNYDQEVFLAAHQWNPEFVSMQDIRKGPPPDNGMEVMYQAASINDKALGHGEPIRVKTGERVLFHVLNASATDDIRLALPGHDFNVIALDGNPVPNPRAVPVLVLAPAERIDAIVEMKQPGVWVFGATEDSMREMGMGVVIEYAGPARQRPSGRSRSRALGITPSLERTRRLLNRTTVSTLYLKKSPAVTAVSIVGRLTASPGRTSEPLMVKAGRRYRFVMENKSGDDHPIHLHRHTFEITRIGWKNNIGNSQGHCQRAPSPKRGNRFCCR